MKIVECLVFGLVAMLLVIFIFLIPLPKKPKNFEQEIIKYSGATQEEIRTNMENYDAVLEYKLPIVYVQKKKYYRIKVLATAYCPCSKCCGKFADGITAIGRNANKAGIAVDPKVIPLRSRVDIPNYPYNNGNWIMADDIGGAIKGKHIDLRMRTHQEALKWGRKWITIRVWKK